MFSGIIKTLGIVELIIEHGSTREITISSAISDSLSIDQSIAHDGVCLTVVKVETGKHIIEVVNETLSKTNLGEWKKGDVVNLEKSISPTTLLDGHLVQGHVDTTLNCIGITDLDGSWMFSFEAPRQFAGLLVPQGSICINGVSLTIADLNDHQFSVSIIPYTYQNTNFKYIREGDKVNIEFDLIGKYIVRQFQLQNLTE